MMMSNLFLFNEVTEEEIEKLDGEQMELLSNWVENGGSPTLKALTECKPELIEDIIEYLKDIPVYDMVTVGGWDFFLSHIGLANFEMGKKDFLNTLSSEEALKAAISEKTSINAPREEELINFYELKIALNEISFENYQVDSTNVQAYQKCKTLALTDVFEKKVLIYGPKFSGNTHLVTSMLDEILKEIPVRKQ